MARTTRPSSAPTRSSPCRWRWRGPPREDVGLPLYRYLGGPMARVLPVPMMNILNGGAHATQQRRCPGVHGGADRHRQTFPKRCGWASKCFTRSRKCSPGWGSRPPSATKADLRRCFRRTKRRSTSIMEAIRRRGISRARTSRSRSTWRRRSCTQDGEYVFKKGDGAGASARSWSTSTRGWVDRYPIVSIEDGLAEDDWDGWALLTEALQERVQLVGDDLFVTNVDRLARGSSRTSPMRS